MRATCLLVLLLAPAAFADPPPAGPESQPAAAAGPQINTVKELLAAAEAERKATIDRINAELKSLPKAKLSPEERAQRSKELRHDLLVTQNQAGKAPAMVYKAGHAGEVDPDTVDIRIDHILGPDAAIVDVRFFQVNKRLVGGKLVAEGKRTEVARRSYIMRPLDTKGLTTGNRIPPPRYAALGPQEQQAGKNLLVLTPLKP